jgi:DEAD/DEAH box helicase domain-containing protein
VDVERTIELLTADEDHAACVAHVERLPARDPGPVPDYSLPPELTARMRRLGIERLWSHQAEALRHARARRNVAVATGTASGKSLVYQLTTFERFMADRRATALYLFPTKALARDQLRHVRGFVLPDARAAVYDGDTPGHERAAIRRAANLVITNPDMLHYGILPTHQRWAQFFKGLAVVAVDEMHVFRGIFGSHVANILRRLLRVARHYGADPQLVTASATIGNPAGLSERLFGTPFEEVTHDASPRGEKVFVLWNPPQDFEGRRSTIGEASRALAQLANQEVRTIAFARSRKAAELIAGFARGRVEPHVEGRIAAYRAGYLPEERRALEGALASGELIAVAATNALELGIDIGGLDACVLAGYPGTVAGTWQQAGRAGREMQQSLAVLIAQDDPLDQYIVNHPQEIFGRPHEAAVVDHANPNILDAHVACAAYEVPITDADERAFGPALPGAIARLAEAALLRKRGEKWFYGGRGSPAQDVDVRSSGRVVAIVEEETGSLLGTADEARAPYTVHPGAIYLHQGEQFEVAGLDLDRRVALVHRADADFYTQARDITDVRVLEVERKGTAGRVELLFGRVEVTDQVVSYARKRIATGELLDVVPLDMPQQTLETRAVWYAVPDALLDEAGVDPPDVAGAAHAAEHAAIGLTPLFAMCDRWDVGGVSYEAYPETGQCTVFVYDGYPGGAGIAERCFEAGAEHLRATLEAIRTCPCESGCPSCVQSPKCGNGNNPLDKAGAQRLLSTLLGDRRR